MASIQNVKGRWFGRYVDPATGKRISVPLGDSEQAAQAWETATERMEGHVRQALSRHAREAEKDAAQRGEPTLGQALGAFLGFLGARVQGRTLERYRGHQRCLERLLALRSPVGSFGPSEVDRLVQTRLREGVDPRTIAKEQAFLRRLVRFLHERWPACVPRDWSSSTALKVLPDSAGGERNRQRRVNRPVLSPERVKALLQALPADTRLGQRVRFLLLCPVRPVEMLRLRVGEVDLAAGVLSVRIRKNGRAGGERTVAYPVVRPLRAVLEAAIRGKHPEALVFPAVKGNVAQSSRGLCGEWSRWRESNPQFGGVQLYALRRTVGTAADRTATNAIVAMGVLNHRTWGAHKHYSDLDAADARKALEAALASLGLTA